jgi:hypothetical protein
LKGFKDFWRVQIFCASQQMPFKHLHRYDCVTNQLLFSASTMAGFMGVDTAKWKKQQPMPRSH